MDRALHEGHPEHPGTDRWRQADIRSDLDHAATPPRPVARSRVRHLATVSTVGLVAGSVGVAAVVVTTLALVLDALAAANALALLRLLASGSATTGSAPAEPSRRAAARDERPAAS
jgi:hypothetical protein